MKRCSNCGKENPDKKFCGYCGAKLSDNAWQPRNCPYCGYSENMKDAKYCASCGKALSRTKVRNPIMWVAPIVCAVMLWIGGCVYWMNLEKLPVADKEISSSSMDLPNDINSNKPLVSTDQPEKSPVIVAQPDSDYTSKINTKEDSTVSTSPAIKPPVSKWNPPIYVDGGNSHTVILYGDGTVKTIGDDSYGQRSTSGWRDIYRISTFADHTLGLREDGTVVAAGANRDGQCEVSDWHDIVDIAAGSRHSVGVCEDGTVVAVGANEAGQCDVSHWTNVRSVEASNSTTFAVTYDGKILTAGSFSHNGLKKWSDIISISVSANHVIGVHSDYTVSAVGANDYGQCDNMEKWMDTMYTVAGYGFSAGLSETGKVWVHGCDEHNEHAAMQWTDIVAIGSGKEHIIGIKEDGTLVAIGTNDDYQCNVKKLNTK